MDYHLLVLWLKMWTLWFTVASVLFQVVNHLALQFIDLLDLALRQELAILSIVFLTQIEDLLAALEALLDGLLGLLVVGGFGFLPWTKCPHLLLVGAERLDELLCGGLVESEFSSDVHRLFLCQLLAAHALLLVLGCSRRAKYQHKDSH